MLCGNVRVCREQIALPTAPTDVIISEVAATSVRLEWSYKGPEDLQYYVIQYKPKNANQVSWNVLLFRFQICGRMNAPHSSVVPSPKKM